MIVYKVLHSSHSDDATCPATRVHSGRVKYFVQGEFMPVFFFALLFQLYCVFERFIIYKLEYIWLKAHFLQEAFSVYSI